jgi:wyosine [tRNA(Phe)-imidazoG37] synthetase (radical SAM superfamily)
MNKIRKDYNFAGLEQLATDFRVYLQQSVAIDAIVISGNGEPTLHPQFEEAARLIMNLRNEHLPGRKVILLTNGAHFDSRKVIAGANLVDERIVKIDAGSDACMTSINDPLVRINMTKLLTGIRKLKDCVVQALFVDGERSNVGNEIIDEWIEVVGMVKPKSVQICTMSRPGFSNLVRAVSEDMLDGIAHKLKKRTNLECEVFAVHNR